MSNTNDFNEDKQIEFLEAMKNNVGIIDQHIETLDVRIRDLQKQRERAIVVRNGYLKGHDDIKENM